MMIARYANIVAAERQRAAQAASRERATIKIVPLSRELLLLALATMRAGELALEIERQAWADKVMAPPAVAYAFLEGGYVLGCGGLFLHWAGCGDIWMLVTRFARRRHLALGTRFGKLLMDREQRNPLWRRIELRLPLTAPWRTTFARGLGFAGAGQLQEAWGPDGNDYVLYARIAREERG